MSGRAVLRGGLVLTIGNLMGALASFARNIIVARLISVEDFGIASLLALSMSFIEMVSSLAIDRILVQARDGDADRMQSTGQAFQAIRGIGCGLVLYFAAEYLAHFFDVGHATWAFQVLAIVPAIRGFLHLDSMRLQRELKFAVSVWMEVVPQIAALGLAIPLGIWLGDYRVMLWVIVLQIFLQVVISHVLATRRYVWAWDREIIGRMVSFGWPMMVNGLLMFIIFQGDKAIIGYAFSMDELGWYSAAFMLSLAPAMIITKVLQSLLLPLLSKVQDNRDAFFERYVLALQLCLLAGIGLGAALVVAGPSLVVLFYGERYADGATVIALLGLMQAARIAKAGPMISAMALGSTENAMYSNTARLATLVLAIYVVWQGGGIVEIALVGTIGELLSYCVSLVLLKTMLQLPILQGLKAVGLASALAMALYLSAPLFLVGMPHTLQIIVGILAAPVILCICLLLMPEATQFLKRFPSVTNNT